MNKITSAFFAIVATLAFAPAASYAADAVPTTDWSYSAVQDLASKGLIQGYPKDKDLFQGREVSRYEMAALVQRAIARLTDDQAAAVATPQTLDELGKLIAQYKIELAVMGTDIADLKLGESKLTDQVLDQQKQINSLSKSKVDSGIAKVQLSGLFQEWFADGGDVANTGKNPGAISNSFRIRRAELRVKGNIDPKTYFNVMLDPSKNLSLIASTKTVATTPTVTQTTYSVNQNGIPLQDFILGYQLTPQFAAELGQQKIPLSLEGYYRASSNLLTIERSLLNTAPYNQGRVGDIRDLGATFRYTQPKAGIITLAVLNDAGATQNYSYDVGNAKSLLYNGQVTAIPGLIFGGYGEVRTADGNNGTASPATTPTTPTGIASPNRQRTGGDFDYVNGPHELTGEYEQGYDGDNSATTLRQSTKTAYAIYAYKLNPTWQGVVRYDWFQIYQTPFGTSTTTSNDEHDLTLGVNYYIHGNNSKIQFNYIKKTISGPLTAPTASVVGPALIPSLGVSRDQYFVAFQQQF